MRWFRTNRRFAGALALFALALQITLAFGHIHVRDFAGLPGIAAQAPANAQLPAGHKDSDRSADGYCLVCATVSLAGMLVLPASTALPGPAGVTTALYWHACASACTPIQHALFYARGPPLA